MLHPNMSSPFTAAGGLRQPHTQYSALIKSKLEKFNKTNPRVTQFDHLKESIIISSRTLWSIWRSGSHGAFCSRLLLFLSIGVIDPSPSIMIKIKLIGRRLKRKLVSVLASQTNYSTHYLVHAALVSVHKPEKDELMKVLKATREVEQKTLFDLTNHWYAMIYQFSNKLAVSQHS